MITKYPDAIEVLLRFKGKRVYTPGEVVTKDELEKNFKIQNLNALIWNNQVKVIEDQGPEEIEEVVNEVSTDDTPKKRGRSKK